MSARVLIIGGGLAGLFCALKLAPNPVTVLASLPIGQGASSAWAQGGIAAAMGEGDTPESHTADTLVAGAGIVDEAVMLGMAREAKTRILDLLAYGVPFDKDVEGHLVPSREAAHSHRRIIRVRGDMAGKAIMQALIATVRATPSICVVEDFTALSLLRQDERVVGVRARNVLGHDENFLANATILATGGIGQLYGVTTNPSEARGLGLALAARAGAIIADGEFVQFHPTAIDIGRDPAPLATEALRGDGAILVNRLGERFMTHLHPDAELAPRDIVARGVFAEIAAGRGAFLDGRLAPGAAFQEKFPTVYATCLSAGIDPISALIPIAPAEHYHMGGIWTDPRGRTTLAGLWAMGEVASTGVHGANRLASNSLLEAVVFAARVAQDVGAVALSGALPGQIEIDRAQLEVPDERAMAQPLREIMASKVGVIRKGEGLRQAILQIAAIGKAAQSPILRLMATSALMIAVSAWQRKESRGAHFREDFPHADPLQAHRSRLSWAEALTIARQMEEA